MTPRIPNGARPARPGSRHRLRGWRPLVAVAAVIALPLLSAAALPGALGGADGPRLPAQKPVPVHVVHGHRGPVPVMHRWHRPAVSWPAAGTAVAAVPANGGAATRAGTAAAGPGGPGGLVRPGGLPVRVAGISATKGRDAGHSAGRVAGSVPSRVRVRVLSHAAALRLGVRGVVFTVARADGMAAAGRVRLSLGYSSFAYGYGGDYASRLRLVELPSCALTTPRVAACRAQTPLSSADNVQKASLGADVTVPPAAVPSAPLSPAAVPSAPLPPAAVPSAGAAAGDTGAAGATATGGAGFVVLAAATSPSGSGGNFAASPLAEAGSWSGGEQSGAFDYSYPISVPPVPGGLEPQVSLGYNSQEADGLTSSTDNQASWIGDGWNYAPGYIERDYQSCEQNPAGKTQTGDFCWSSNNVTTLSLNGQDTTLVQDSSTGAWHPEADQNEKVSYQSTGSATTNGTHDGDYWVITEPDGTKYYFGMNELPGWSSSKATTNSAWTMPVYATKTGQPCYNSDFADADCPQAWRWNLDYVVDPHGNAVAYFYNTETNYYARDGGTTANAAYTQAGALSKIEYGLRSNTVYSAAAAAQVNFATSASRTDVPTDLSCSSGQSCDVQSPTFWGKYQLTSISTQTLEGSSLQKVDSWALSQTYPATGDKTTPPSLWLSSITRTGQDGTAVSLPPVTFTGKALANRVETGDGYSDITRLRMVQITNETGGQTDIGYDTPAGACGGSGSFPAPDDNTSLCYPDWWNPGSGLIESWFNKYVATQVDEDDTTGGGVPVSTTYSYGGAAWHYDDNPLALAANRTWDQWRGFQTVTTETGSSPQTEEVATYFQGMNGDYDSTKTVTLTSSQGDDVVTDSDQYDGMEFEDIVYDGAGSGNEVTDTITLPWTSAATATQSQPSPLPSLSSYLTGTAQTRVYTALASGGSRESDTTYTHDSYGRVSTESDVPDTSDAAEDTCTTTTYASNTSAWIMNLPAEVQVVSVPCSTTAQLPADAVSDTLTFYDGATKLGSDTPTAGNVTMTQLATSYTGSTPVYTTQSAASYDAYGRALTSADADNRTTATAYTPAAGAEPTSVSVTDPAGLVTTTTYDPARDLPLVVTAPDGRQTSKTYDALGRLTGVWLPGQSETADPAFETFAYAVSDTVPSVTTTSTVNSVGGYTTAQTLDDSLGRPVETQTETADGNRDITDTYYNAAGWPILDSGSYYTTGAPDGTLVAARDAAVPSQTGYLYDGDGRVTRQIAYTYANETWETDTTYGGDYTTVVPPAGGTSQTTFTNGEGQTSAIYQYHAGVPASPADPSSDYDQTTYTYTPAQQLAGIQDAAGNQWSYSYDLAGDQKSATDPDTGTTASTYDPAGQLITSTDARGKQTSYVYDADGRKTAEYDTTGGAAETGSDELASWTYDTLAKGELTSSTAYVGGTGGSAYTTQTTGYYNSGLPEGTKTIILQGALAGSYTTDYAYNQYTQSMSSYYDSAAGGLPAETVDIGYDVANEPDSLIAPAEATYVKDLQYTELGQPEVYTLGSDVDTQAAVTDSYDPETGRVTGTEVQTGNNLTDVDNTSYVYDNDGNITSEADTPPATSAQQQCFQYDYLGRLTQAWAQGSSGCASKPSQSAESGAAAPYWQSYNYNDVNDLTSQASTPPSGAATTTTDSYPPAGSPQPHAPAAAKVSGPSGTTTTSYGYNAAGDTTSITSPSSTQNLNWNDAGQLSAVTTTGQGAGTTSYVYDAGGSLLLQSDPGSTTLYLPDEQIVSNGGTVTGTRYYSIGGVTVAARTSAGPVYYLTGDIQGTMTLAIDASSLLVNRRYYDPYGNPIGAAPSAWPGTRGFVGGTADPATGLTNLGAREYNPGTSTFVSPDPLITPYQPQDLNAYAYAGDNPSTDSDPSGAMRTWGDGVNPCPNSPSYACAPQGGHNGDPHPYVGRTPGSYTLPVDIGHYLLPQLVDPPPTPVVHKITSSSQASPPACGGNVVSRFAGPSSACTMPATSSSGGGGWGWLGTAAHWAYQHRVAIVNYVALGTCLSGVGLALCAGAQALAYAVRAQARIQRYGFSRSLDSNAVDLLSTALSITIAGAADAGTAGTEDDEDLPPYETPVARSPYPVRVAVGAVASIPDMVSSIGSYLPSHDPVYFNSTP